MHKQISFISEPEFATTVLQAEGLVIVSFWADWCGKCKMVDPLLDEVANQVGDKVTIVKVDLDREPGLAQLYPLFHVPALLFFKKGLLCDHITTSVPKAELLSKIETHTTFNRV
jgi:thioredoxin 1